MSKNTYAFVAVFGFLTAFGAVGTIEVDPNASLFRMVAIAVTGLALMYAGINGVKEQ